MKKIISLFMITVLLLTHLSQVLSFGNQYVILRSDTTGKILQAIDGETLKVEVTGTKQIALVKLIGVDSQGYDKALPYLTTEYVGKNVTLLFDRDIYSPEDRWNVMYVYCGDVLINSQVLKQGYGQLNKAHSNASMYDSLLSEESYGKQKQIGLWTVDNKIYNYGSNYYAGNGANINTATESQLSSILTDIDSNTISEIVYYRSYHPYNTVRDIKFVSGFTKDMYDKNRSLMTVCTNINTATEKELLTLRDISQSDVDSIINYRSKRTFTNKTQLYTDNVISRSDYDANAPFIDIEDKSILNYARPDYVVNVNTATDSQLSYAGVSSSQASNIMRYRGNYSYKNLGELTRLTGGSYSTSSLNYLADNLHTMTDINNASLDEIRSLFGDNGSYSDAEKLYNNRPYSTKESAKSYMTESYYDSIETYIYVDDFVTSYTNINTATRAQLSSLGLTESQTSAIYNRQRNMNNSSDIPLDSDTLKKIDGKISLYTNINTASSEELQTLFSTTSSSIANDIVNYRNDQPFGDLDEVRTFFDSKTELGLYNDVKNYIVLR